ncbi:MAG: hypothetical protein K5927_02605 [Lachnospiraceae bacterium]|nr:hypothetical protein [Lachnospiraceae bacterium]
MSIPCKHVLTVAVHPDVFYPCGVFFRFKVKSVICAVGA